MSYELYYNLVQSQTPFSLIFQFQLQLFYMYVCVRVCGLDDVWIHGENVPSTLSNLNCFEWSVTVEKAFINVGMYGTGFSA